MKWQNVDLLITCGDNKQLSSYIVTYATKVNAQGTVRQTTVKYYNKDEK